MKKWNGYFALLVLVGTGTANAQEQEITMVYEAALTTAGSRGVGLYYNSTNGDLTTGIGFRVHFNSSLVEIVDIKNHHENSNLGLQIMQDSDDLDDDPSTDAYINAAWVDLLGNWPDVESLPAVLYSLEYRATRAAGDDDLFKITPIATAAGFDFAARIVR